MNNEQRDWERDCLLFDVDREAAGPWRTEQRLVCCTAGAGGCARASDFTVWLVLGHLPAAHQLERTLDYMLKF